MHSYLISIFYKTRNIRNSTFSMLLILYFAQKYIDYNINSMELHTLGFDINLLSNCFHLDILLHFLFSIRLQFSKNVVSFTNEIFLCSV